MKFVSLIACSVLSLKLAGAQEERVTNIRRLRGNHNDFFLKIIEDTEVEQSQENKGLFFQLEKAANKRRPLEEDKVALARLLEDNSSL